MLDATLRKAPYLSTLVVQWGSLTMAHYPHWPWTHWSPRPRLLQLLLLFQHGICAFTPATPAQRQRPIKMRSEPRSHPADSLSLLPVMTGLLPHRAEGPASGSHSGRGAGFSPPSQPSCSPVVVEAAWTLGGWCQSLAKSFLSSWMPFPQTICGACAMAALLAAFCSLNWGPAGVFSWDLCPITSFSLEPVAYEWSL